MPSSYLPVLLAVIVAVSLGVALLSLSYLLARKVSGRVQRTTYESGAPLLDGSRKRLSIAFFLVAIAFVIFEVELAYLFPWVLVAREGGWPLLAAFATFLGLLVVALAYLWRTGGLQVRPESDR